MRVMPRIDVIVLTTGETVNPRRLRSQEGQWRSRAGASPSHGPEAFATPQRRPHPAGGVHPELVEGVHPEPVEGMPPELRTGRRAAHSGMTPA